MLKAVITDSGFVSRELEANVIEEAGFALKAVIPVCKTEEDVIRTCGDADVLLVQWAPVTRRAMAALPKVRGIVRYGIGVNNLDLDGARELGVAIANVPSYCLDEVSNHTIAFLLALCRRIPQDRFGILQGKWGTQHHPLPPAFDELTLGLVGFGAIARLVAKKAAVFGFRIVAADPYQPDEAFAVHGIERCDLETLLRSSDIVSLHCPLVAETKHLIRAESIAKMPRGAILLNTARGAIVKEDDLVAALLDGHLLAAGLDVFEQEPLPTESPLRTMPNVLLTSHAASLSTRATTRLQVRAAEAARDILLAKKPEGVLVWGERAASPTRTEKRR